MRIGVAEAPKGVCEPRRLSTTPSGAAHIPWKYTPAFGKRQWLLSPEAVRRCSASCSSGTVSSLNIRFAVPYDTRGERHPSLRFVVVAIIGAMTILPSAYAEEHKKYGADLEGFDYPYEVHRFQFTSQGDEVFMAYMDVLPQQSNGRTAVLLHGRNFCAATWENSINVLREVGFRVIAPDQIGFCKSSKPVHYQFSIQQLAANTNALVKSLGIDRAIYIGHSFGGMTAIRYALMFPEAVDDTLNTRAISRSGNHRGISRLLGRSCPTLLELYCASCDHEEIKEDRPTG